MITFDQARDRAAKAVEPTWDPQAGTLFADMNGLQDKTHYAVHVNAEEWLVDGDLTYMVMDSPLVLVNKKTGVAEVSTYLENRARFDRMRPISSE